MYYKFANTQLGHQTSLLQTRDTIAKIFGLAANVGSFYPFHLWKHSEEIKVFRNILRGVINLTWHCTLEVSFESIVKFLLTHSRLFLFPSGRKWTCGWEPGRIITVIDSWPRNMLYVIIIILHYPRITKWKCVKLINLKSGDLHKSGRFFESRDFCEKF